MTSFMQTRMVYVLFADHVQVMVAYPDGCLLTMITLLVKYEVYYVVFAMTFSDDGEMIQKYSNVGMIT